MNLIPFANLIAVHWAESKEFGDLWNAGPAILRIGQVHLSQRTVHWACVGLCIGGLEIDISQINVVCNSIPLLNMPKCSL